MRKYDVAYVPNGPVNYYPAVPLQDMSLEDIKKKYIKTCAKANGDIAICSKCKTPCKEGERAIQLTANQVYNDPPIPLYGGKTLIERAKEENMKRRQLEAERKANENMEKVEKKENISKKKTVIRWDGWYETSLASGDQVKWLMTEMGLSRTQAKKKIYQYRYLHGLSKTETKKEESIEKQESIVEKPEPSVEKPIEENVIENKLEALMKLQEKYKDDMKKYRELFEEAERNYEDIKKKTDILCSAMDILNN